MGKPSTIPAFYPEVTYKRPVRDPWANTIVI